MLSVVGSGALGAAETTPAERRVELRDRDLVQSEQGRKTLSYLIDCALPAGVVATAEVEGETYSFPGGMGLAPDWLERPASPVEQRWVSACMLARVNFFGTKVKISLRAPGSGHAALEAASEEERDYRLHEGGFFGNLFAAGAPAFVCLGEAARAPRRDPIFEKRVCTAPDPAAPPGSAGRTRCGFLDVGACTGRAAFEAGGATWREVVHVYLKPLPVGGDLVADDPVGGDPVGGDPAK